jgi:hypothetical protein
MTPFVFLVVAVVLSFWLVFVLEAIGALWRAFMLSEGGYIPKNPMTPKERRDFWTCLAVLLLTFAGGIWVHPLFFGTMYVWVAWANYSEHGSIFKR